MKNFLPILFRVLISTGTAILFAGIVIVLYTNAQLPPVRSLEDIQLQVPLKIYSADGKLIGEYGEKRRTPIKIEDVPEPLKLAILATEDRRFYDHNGVDIRGMGRAVMNLVMSGRKSQGASTITMQVARNFFLTRQKTFGRKLNEVLLALKIEKELPKDKILELYLNKIYFGKRAYGVQAAAQVYYGTTVDKLNLAQMAMLAGLPQAPSAINPINNPDAALKRRSHVLKRMLHYGFINEKQFDEANLEPVTANYHGRVVELDAPYVSEMVRRELYERFGPQAYTSGFTAYATVDSRIQNFANRAMHEGLLEYDKRHGYRGAVTKLPVSKRGKFDLDEWIDKLRTYPKSGTLIPAAITEIAPLDAKAILPNHQVITISFESMRWAKPQLTRLILGPEPKTVKDVVSVGDVIYVEPGNDEWLFSQVPEVEGALVSLHPKNGSILALVGGFDFNLSFFNRATQSTRQPGSNFKPFVYAAALEHGYTAATVINDAPIVFHSENSDEAWRPQNDSRRFYGPTRLRVGLTKSRNLVSIRLLQALGIKTAVKVIRRFGFTSRQLPQTLSLALGTATVSPLQVATGYAAFANGGYKVEPHALLKVVDDQGKIVYEASPPVVCPSCQEVLKDQIDPALKTDENAIDQLVKAPETPSNVPSAKQIIDPQTAYIMTSILQDAILTGTGKAALALNRSDLAGKTGTTNNQMDAWYTGFNQSLVTSVWVGFDDPRSLQEYGSQAALPIWMKFMGNALQGVPETRPEQPRGLVTVRIDPYSGLLARPGQQNAIFEIFRQETTPRRQAAAPHSGYGYRGGYGRGGYGYRGGYGNGNGNGNGYGGGYGNNNGYGGGYGNNHRGGGGYGPPPDRQDDSLF
jgi:penicillin-binding protein 1A